MGSISWVLFLLFHNWCIEMQPIAVQWFCTLPLSWIHVLVLEAFCWSHSGFLCRVSCHLRKMKVWPLLCQFGCLLFHFVVWLLREPRTTYTMLNNSGESGHPCSVPDLRGKALTVPLLRIILAVGFSYMGFVMLRYVPSILNFLRIFVKKWC